MYVSYCSDLKQSDSTSSIGIYFESANKNIFVFRKIVYECRTKVAYTKHITIIILNKELIMTVDNNNTVLINKDDQS